MCVPIDGDVLIFTGGSDGAVKKWSCNMLKHQSASGAIARALPFDGVKYLGKIQTEVEGSPAIYTEADGSCKSGLENISKLHNSPKIFIRCLGLISHTECLVCLDNGEVWLWLVNKNSTDSEEKMDVPWQLHLHELAGYSVMATFLDNDANIIAVGGLYGDIFIFQRQGNGFIEHVSSLKNSKVFNTKVFALKWLSNSKLLACYQAGEMVMYHWNSMKRELSHMASYKLPSMKQRWFTSACLLGKPSICDVDPVDSLALLVGDRNGSLHLYDLVTSTYLLKLANVHGSDGVVSLERISGDTAISTGRDGWIKYWRLSCTSQQLALRPVYASKHAEGDWVAKILSLRGDQLVLAFHGIYLQIWSQLNSAHVAQVECGGGHRAWDVFVSPAGASGEDLDLVAVYLKDGKPHHASVRLSSNLRPLQQGIATKAIQCCAALNSSETFGSLVALGGEDNAVRLVHVKSNGVCQRVASICSHISAIRSICIIRNPLGFGTNNEYTHFISVGGRAQVKLWKLKTGSGVNRAIQKVATTNHSEEGVSMTGNVNKKAGDCFSSSSVNQIDNNSEPVDCVELASLQSSSDNQPSSWLHRKTKSSVETRHMACSAIFCSASCALVAVASSDAVLRLFKVKLDSPENPVFEQVSQLECTHCFLNVEILTVPGCYNQEPVGDAQYKFLLRTVDAGGKLIHFTIKVGTNCIIVYVFCFFG